MFAGARHASPLPNYPIHGIAPIEYLWRNTKKRATHDKYSEPFSQVIPSGERSLEPFASHAEAVLALLGRYGHEAGLAVI